jgi:hypothetical protein
MGTSGANGASGATGYLLKVGDFALGKRERRMNEPRKLALVMLLVMTALTLSVATPAYGDAAHAVEQWASYVCYYLEFC